MGQPRSILFNSARSAASTSGEFRSPRATRLTNDRSTPRSRATREYNPLYKRYRRKSGSLVRCFGNVGDPRPVCAGKTL